MPTRERYPGRHAVSEPTPADAEPSRVGWLSPSRGWGGLRIRILFSIGLMTVLLWRLDVSSLGRHWREIRLEHFLLALLLLAASNVAGTVQWMMLLRIQGLRPRLGSVLASYHAGLFFSNFMPGHYGGDVVRVYDMYKEGGNAYAAFAATLLDRIVGFVSLCVLALCVAPGFLGGGERRVLALVMLVTLMLGGAGVLMFSRRAGRVAAFLLRPIRSSSAFRHIRGSYEAIHLYRAHARPMLAVFGVSLAVQALRILVHFETGLAVGAATAWRDYFFVIPVVAVVIAVPISLNGIGLREGSGILLFQQVGMDGEQAFALMLLAYVAGVVASLPGGVVFALRRRARGPALVEPGAPPPV